VPESPEGAGGAATATPAAETITPWVILPTYNEAENLERIVGAVLRQLPSSRRILIVDDNSPDGTGAIADRLAASDDSVAVLHRPRKQGPGPAYLAAFHVALDEGADRIIEMDADFSHDPAYLPELIEATEHADLAIGSRYVPGGGITEWGPVRRFISRGGSAYARLALGLPVRDLTGGFKCYRRVVLETINLDTIEARGYAFQVETTYRAISAGFRVVEIPITFRDRADGTSKMTRSIVAEAMWRVPAMRFRRW
jgi:dolichol-phosphate mannosyltransferase